MSGAPLRTQALTHAKIQLALHTLHEQPGPRLLLLHALAKASPARLPESLAKWPGSVFALDFTGHGQSTIPHGGGYTAELLMADADAALAEIGKATLLGEGLGGYVAVLLAGARPQLVHGAIVCDGRGLTGGGVEPGPPTGPISVAPSSVSPDPFALRELERDMRPTDYAMTFVQQAALGSGLREPISICAAERPPWLAALLNSPAVTTGPVDEALERYASR